ncbi:SDR family NAD(P)-dependent oxidoreductase [Polymorphobacter megasporae]|uniref:SDR family NAD(P)-dependent oxidoreductase n=1 Tax=Glacieibacterium megasporae TaxID=2835787 RepID=UPI001C1E24D7|nr:SDR family NAD(P)-dependent oxidoreductase [Polymorphobacter megasporae]UAJ12030.1 SDR family NAD(P)-dependent oxidoreductase [Polymorphobacter megasporae]
MLILGLGYTTTLLARRLVDIGWRVTATRRQGDGDAIAFDSDDVAAAIDTATHILSSVPPVDDHDPVLTRYGARLAAAPANWVGYLSSTGVYGDAGGAWVDEASPVGFGRRSARMAADLAWQQLRDDVRVFRLPGIYGPGRSVIDRVRAGAAQRIDAPSHRFSRIHVDDIVRSVEASFDRGAPGVFNIADEEPATSAAVIEYACNLLGMTYPPLESLGEARMSPMARGFYAESRQVAAGKMTRELGIRLTFPDFRSGLRACL